MLQLQRPTGAWKGSSLTGFVSTGYALQALARYFPTEPPAFDPTAFEATTGESLLDAVRRVRQLSVLEDPRAAPLLIAAASHRSPLVRYWAMIGLGGLHLEAGVAPLVAGLGDRAKLVREAAHWGLRQTLIDDVGWDLTLKAARDGDDYTRESAMRALWMRVDGVLPGISVDWDALASIMADALNQDPHPAVRAWSARAMWNWWIWNPPLRPAINQAWVAMLNRLETSGLVENCLRYQTHALFVVNGHHANTSSDHQYPELGALFKRLEQDVTVANADPARKDRLIRRLIAVGATYYNTAGGDGGPGQMGYSTPGAGTLFGAALLQFLEGLEQAGITASQHLMLRVALESAAHVPDDALQQRLIHYSLNAPEDLRMIAASSVSDPRSAQFAAVPERIEPLVRQILRGADEPARRTQLSDPIISLFTRVRWIVPDSLEQQRELMKYLVPPLTEYNSREEIQAIIDGGRRRQVERTMSASWYLAEEMGSVLGSNDDLHIETALKTIPERAANPLQARFWLPSVVWILEFAQPPPHIENPQATAGTDAYEPFRRRAMQLFLNQLTPDAHPKLRQLAVRMAHATPLRKSPRVLAALEAVLDFEVRATVRIVAEHVLA
ncbi:MAG: HEAT repeat domain-containing protein, partial [Planctomycetaceae bacterium]